MYQVKCPHCDKKFDIALPVNTKTKTDKKKIVIDNKRFFGGIAVIMLILWLLG
jgi:hypothetical protein